VFRNHRGNDLALSKLALSCFIPRLVDATIIVSKNYPIIGEHVAIIFLAQKGYHSNRMT